MLGFSTIEQLSSLSIVERDLIILTCEKCRSEEMDTDDIGSGFIRVYDYSDMKLVHTIDGRNQN